MDTDLVLTFGILLLVLTLPLLFSAWVDQRVPWVSLGLMVTALGLILGAVMIRPGGYSFAEVPEVMLGVFARLIN